MKPLNPPPPMGNTQPRTAARPHSSLPERDHTATRECTPPSETAATRRDSLKLSTTQGSPVQPGWQHCKYRIEGAQPCGYPPGNRRTTLPLDARIPATSALGPCKHPTTGGWHPTGASPTHAPPARASTQRGLSPKSIFALPFSRGFFSRASVLSCPSRGMIHASGCLA